MLSMQDVANDSIEAGEVADIAVVSLID